MELGKVQVYYGNGQGKTSAAIGNLLRYASNGSNAIIVQFMKEATNTDYLARLEPEIRLFRFERSTDAFDDLPEEAKQEEKLNIENGLNFAKKVLTTDGCDVLFLDEVLGLVETGIIEDTELLELLSLRSPFTTVILTGRTLPESIRDAADEVVNLVCEKPLTQA